MKIWIPFLFIVLWFAGLSSCSSSGGGTAYEKPSVYFSTMEKLTLEVVYEPGAEPFVGNGPNGQSLWSVTEVNLNALFQGRTKVPTFVVPKTLAEMTALETQNQTGWTNDELLALASKSRKNQSTATSTHFFVAFLKGHYEEDGAVKTGVIGVSLTGTTVIALFKEVVQSTGSHPNGAVPKFVEQSTVVHESAHALGLTNNGIPMKASHHDATHGAHCTDTDCVMYYLNEGTSDLVTFVQNFLLTASPVMFDAQCLDDARSYVP